MGMLFSKCQPCKPACPPKPPVEFVPIDLFKCGCESFREAQLCFGETDAWIICAPDCETITFAKKVRLSLGSVQNGFSQNFSTAITECRRSFLIRPDEWKKHPELGECPKRGFYVYVECTKETIELGPDPDNGVPTFEASDGYICLWRVNGKAVRPCFSFVV